MGKIFAYMRVSTDKQDVENQRFELDNYCRKRAMIIDEIIEEIISGTADSKDRKIGDLLSKMQRGDTLVVAEISRISRRLFHVISMLKTCMDRGISIHAVKEGYILDDSLQSKIMAMAFGMAAEIERNMISMRTKEALARKRAEGVVLGRPKGRKSKEKKLDKQIEEIKDLLSKNISKSAIARITGCHRLTVATFIKENSL